jgi:CHAT domain-containing protein
VIGLVEYYATPERTLIFGVRSDKNKPRVFEARFEGRSLGETELQVRAQRLLLDFHGLPWDWEQAANAPELREALTLSPAVHPAKRAQPLLQRNLKEPAFTYQLNYLEELSVSLLPPELCEWLADCELLCLVPHGPLHSLPFAALRLPDGEYMIERFGVCTAHSASVLRTSQAKNPARNVPEHTLSSCLIAAVAASDDQDPDVFEGDGEQLADTVGGLDEPQITELVGASQSNGKRPASKSTVLEELPNHQLIHLACHGVFGADGGAAAPLDEAGLLVSNGETTLALAEFPGYEPSRRSGWFLTAREVLKTQLAADLVTLRACSSGRSAAHAGDELLGLTRAFLYAGTPSLIVAQWNVNKSSSQKLLSDFYRRWLSDKQPKWRALRLAQQETLRTEAFSHPYHWAAFTLVGDWL